ncbi:alpha/beta fold hydrolase [Pseudomonas paralcaligenes]|uniref:alpha/beta fold hydrolase n=1 Tax=Pseudomonas paralcaligenes TaxID=2772558 RepID=UPI0021D34A60|nr:alpha/beta hydrolase [Pseudomonas paralcaligenes]
MRLVLLPGLNGSNRLFAPLLAQLADVPCQVIELPRQGRQDHDALAFTLKEQLGTAPFVLLGESFSGALAHRLALQCPEGLAGLIFAASFLQRPHPLLTTWSSRLPVPKALLAQPWLLRLFCIGDAQPSVLEQLRTEILDLSPELLSARLKALAALRPPTQRVSIPALHLWPTRDRLVTNAAAASLARGCDNLLRERIEGPHFLLQNRHQDCARAIRAFMEKLRG